MLFSRSTLLSSAPSKKRARVRIDDRPTSVDRELPVRLPVAYHCQPHAADGRRQLQDNADQAAVPSYQAAVYDARDSVLLDGCSGREAAAKTARSRSLPTSKLDVADSEDSDSSPDQPCVVPDVFHARRKNAEPVEYDERSRYPSSPDPEQTASSYVDRDSMSLLTASDWTTVDRPTQSADIETVL